MLRNIPNKYCQKELLEDLELMGFHPARQIDFFYLPVDQETGANLGYAFVNLSSREYARAFLQLDGANFSRYATRKVINVGIATVQGLEENWIFYQRSSAMRNSDLSRRPLFWFKPGSELEKKVMQTLPHVDDENEEGCPAPPTPQANIMPLVTTDESSIVKEGPGAVPKFSSATPIVQTWTSTLMLRNIRNKFGQRDLLDELEYLGFFPGVHIDFFYLPMDTTTGLNLGYAFVNFVSSKAAEDFQALNGRCSNSFKRKELVVTRATVQGLQMNWDLYQRSSSMNSSDLSRRPCFWPQNTLKCRQEAYTPSTAEQIPKIPSCPPNNLLRFVSKEDKENDEPLQGTEGSKDKKEEIIENKEDIRPPLPAEIPQTALLNRLHRSSTVGSNGNEPLKPIENHVFNCQHSNPSIEKNTEPAKTVVMETGMAKFCGNCGSKRMTSLNDLPAVFCTECGTPFDRFDVEIETNATNTGSTITKTTKGTGLENMSPESYWQEEYDVQRSV